MGNFDSQHKPRCGNTRSTEEGLVAPFVAAAILMLLAMAALAIDEGLAYMNQRRIHVGADAASYAAVNLLSDTVTLTDIRNEAIGVAGLNGVSAPEVISVQCGEWSAPNFSPCCSVGCDCTNCNEPTVNAVRVEAQRSVPTLFAKVMGASETRPRAFSIAYGQRGAAQCAKPIGFEYHLFAPYGGVEVGETFTVGRLNSGNWGKVDIGGNMSSGQNFSEAMLEENCVTAPAVGEDVSVGTGFGGSISHVFEDVIEAGKQFNLLVPVTTVFPNGNGNVTVQQYAKVDYIGDNGRNGANWEGTFRLVALNVPVSGAGGSVTNRIIVK